MAYKKLSEATLVESVAEEATMLIEENDEIKRASVKDTMEKYGMSAGGGGGGGFKILQDYEQTYENGLMLYDAFFNGERLYYREGDLYLLVYGVDKGVDEFGDPYVQFCMASTTSQYYNKVGFSM